MALYLVGLLIGFRLQNRHPYLDCPASFKTRLPAVIFRPFRNSLMRYFPPGLDVFDYRLREQRWILHQSCQGPRCPFGVRLTRQRREERNPRVDFWSLKYECSRQGDLGIAVPTRQKVWRRQPYPSYGKTRAYDLPPNQLSPALLAVLQIASTPWLSVRSF